MDIESFKVFTEPNWEYELVSCILEREGKREAKVVNERALFQPQKEIDELLKNINIYKEKVLEEILPILDKYPDIMPYFEVSSVELDNRARPILSNLTSQKKLSKAMSREEIDILMKEAFEDFAKAMKEEMLEEIKISNLSELINFLKVMDAEDSVKMRLILFYSERYSLIPRIQEFLAEGIKVLKQNYPLIKEEFDKALESFQDKRSMENYLEKLGIIKLANCSSMTVQPCIITFNQMSVDWKEEDNNKITIDTGMYIFMLNDIAKNNVLSDSKIVGCLKALGDATRIKIVHMLSGKRMYIQEIADAVGLTPATVSHHINILLQEGLVSVTVDVEKAKKIYYEINTERFSELGETVKLISMPPKTNMD